MDEAIEIIRAAWTGEAGRARRRRDTTFPPSPSGRAASVPIPIYVGGGGPRADRACGRLRRRFRAAALERGADARAPRDGRPPRGELGRERLPFEVVAWAGGCRTPEEIEAIAGLGAGELGDRRRARPPVLALRLAARGDDVGARAHRGARAVRRRGRSGRSAADHPRSADQTLGSADIHSHEETTRWPTSTRCSSSSPSTPGRWTAGSSTASTMSSPRARRSSARSPAASSTSRARPSSSSFITETTNAQTDQRRHVITNVMLESETKGARASSRSSSSTAAASTLKTTGVYTVDLVEEDGGLRFKRMQLDLDAGF